MVRKFFIRKSWRFFSFLLIYPKDAYYTTYDATKAGPIPEKEWPKYQKIFLSDQAVKNIPDTPINSDYEYGLDTLNYIKPDHQCPIRRK